MKKKFKNVYCELKTLSIKSFLMLLISGCINAFGVTVFLTPVGLYDSGISGTSILLAQITPEFLTLSVFLVVLNVPLFLYGLKKTGNRLYGLFHFRRVRILRSRLADYRCASH